MHSIDLNCDLGESFGAYTIGLDETVTPHVTSVNIACGWHAGDPLVMERTVALAKQCGVADEVYAYVKYQIGALYAFARSHHMELQHMKAHGSLYNMAGKDIRLAEAMCRACRDFDSQLILLALAGSKMEEAAQQMGVPCAREFFADRAYSPDGSLAPRSMPGAVLHDTQVALDRVVKMIQTGKVKAIDGTEIPVACDSICVHGDNESAVAFVTAIRHRLEEEGIACRPFGASLR